MSSSPREAAGAATPPPSLVRALQHLLRPLVRVLIENRVTYPILVDLLKAVYLEVGEVEVARDRRGSASRLSLLTGLHRKDVRRLRERAEAEYRPPASVSLGAKLVARWIGSPEYLDAEGRPRPLPRLSRDGRPQTEEGVPSFETLVASVSKDIRPRAVLDEWLRLGIASIDGDDRVRLCVEAFAPRQGFDEKAHYLGRNLHDHIAAAAHNLSGEGSPMLERSVYYDGLEADSVGELSELAERLGMEALRTLNRRALALQRRDADRGAGPWRLNFGVYFFRAAAGKSAGAEDREDV